MISRLVHIRFNGKGLYIGDRRHVPNQVRRTAVRLARSEPCNSTVQRVAELTRFADFNKLYPRLSDDLSQSYKRLSVTEIMRRASQSDIGCTADPATGKTEHRDDDNDAYNVCGRIAAMRVVGWKLVFMDIQDHLEKLQVKINHAELATRCNTNKATEAEAASCSSREQFRKLIKLLRVGDHISVSGKLFLSRSGQISLNADSPPILLAPSLHLIPARISNTETLACKRHVNLLVSSELRSSLRFRGRVESVLRNTLEREGYLNVHTPVITPDSNGATARSFDTQAREFPDIPMKLRVAPELYLKRLIIGNMGRVYEIGSCFRNEGIDSTHNPEFTMCEFYAPYENLNYLLTFTHEILRKLSEHLSEIREQDFPDIHEKSIRQFSVRDSIRRIDFVPCLEEILARELNEPDFSLPGKDMRNGKDVKTVQQEMIQIYRQLNIPLPAAVNIVELMEKLATKFLESQCTQPTWIIHHPEVLSPLAKTFYDQRTKAWVAARAELIADTTEVINCYEEENNPRCQHEKFLSFNRLICQSNADNEDKPFLNADYLQALEWGLPPTSGWGCGIERLCMMMITPGPVPVQRQIVSPHPPPNKDSVPRNFPHPVNAKSSPNPFPHRQISRFFAFGNLRNVVANSR